MAFVPHLEMFHLWETKPRSTLEAGFLLTASLLTRRMEVTTFRHLVNLYFDSRYIKRLLEF